MSIKGFKNTNIYVEGKGIIKTSLLFDEKIRKISNDIESDGLLELDDKYIVVPGFIDEHIHGANKCDAMNGSIKELRSIADKLVEEGTTSFNFTTMTMSKDKILKALEAINTYLKDNSGNAKAIGIHLEGPFISKEYCGAQDKENIVDSDVELLKEFIKASGNNITEITFRYNPNNKEFLKVLLENNIVPSIGHTDNTCAETLEAIENGVKVSTHTFNGMRGIHHREIGTAGAILLSDKINCELICDLHHVSADAIRLLFKNKGKDKIILITDSIEAKYLCDGIYSLGGQKVIVKDGIAKLESGVFAGSTLKLNVAVRNIKDTLNIPLTDAIDMASINPAKNLNVDDRIGSIKVGKDSDFVVIDKDVNVYKTFSKGKLVYSKE